MTILFLFLGAVLGAVIANDHGAGAVFGAMLGLLLARGIALRGRVRVLELKLDALSRASRAGHPAAQSEPVAEASGAATALADSNCAG